MGNLQVDKATYEAAKQTGMEFEILEPIKVKGKEGKQEVFRPTHDAREVRLEAEATAMMEGRVVTEDIGDEIGEDSAGGNDGGGENGTSSGNAGSGNRAVRTGKRRSMWSSGRRDSFDTGATVLSQGMMRTKERAELFEIMDSLFVDGGGMLVLSGDVSGY